MSHVSCWPCFRCQSASARWPTRCSGRIPQYGELSYLREPLKYSFRLTLTLVLLLSLLAAVYWGVLLRPATGEADSGPGGRDTRSGQG